jgi:DNA invertase Pin-like site-specific DNA recombinase
MARKTTPPADPVAVGYGRKSLVKSNRDEVTVAKQKERVTSEAESRRERLVWFEDATGHRSGKFEHTRPGYLRLLEYIETDKNVRSVIFYELDRVGRSVIIIDKILKICQLRGIAFICIKNGIDSTRGLGANEIASIQMQAVFAEHESNRTSERISEMAKYYVANGVPWGPEELSRRDMFAWLIMAVAASYATKEKI